MKARFSFFAFLTFASTVALGQGFFGAFSGTISGVKNQPFSADEVRITDRVLEDGNHIHQETHGKVIRDADGRQRTESEFALPDGNGARHMVNIFDPVGQTTIFLDEERKTATVNHLPDLAISKRVVSNPPVQTAAMPKASRIEMKNEDLGTQVIEGVAAHGVRITRTIPAGLEGNEKPIITVSETWQAADLKIAVLRRSTDPRNGTTEQRLTNIQRVEPDPALFQVPADYEVKENHRQ